MAARGVRQGVQTVQGEGGDSRAERRDAEDVPRRGGGHGRAGGRRLPRGVRGRREDRRHPEGAVRAAVCVVLIGRNTRLTDYACLRYADNIKFAHFAIQLCPPLPGSPMSESGKTVAISPFCKLVIDFMHLGNTLPGVTLDRRMNLAPLVRARYDCRVRPKWT